MFGVSNQDEQIIYLCEGKKELKRRSFGKVVGEAVELLKYADYVYIFGSTESFETEDLEDQISKCERLGIGILSVNFNENGGMVKELLGARRNSVDKQDKKEVSLRVFIRGVNNQIADRVFQAAYEYINREQTNCVSFIDVCNSYFRDERVKQMVRSVIGYHTFVDRDVRAEFQRRYGNAQYIRIEKKADILDDTICFTEVGKKKGKSPILLG